MSTPNPTNPLKPHHRPRRWRRRIAVAVFGLLVVGVAAVLALPWGLSTPFARRHLLARANQVLAPGRLDVEQFAFSWFRPTRMTGFVIMTPDGERVVAAPTAVWDRSLWLVLTRPLDHGTLHLHGPRIDLAEVDPGGTGVNQLNLVEALQAILTPNPRTTLAIEVHAGQLSCTLPGLVQPIEAQLEARLAKPPAPERLNYTLHMTGAKPAWLSPRTLEVTGTYDPWKAVPDQGGDLEVQAEASAWRLDLDGTDRTIGVTLQGGLKARREDGRWASSGMLKLMELAVAPTDPGGPRFELEPIDARWKIAQGASSWDVESLELTGAVGALRITGSTSSDRAQSRIDGDLDLARLLALVPGTTPGLAGYQIEQGRLRIVGDLISRPAAAPDATPSPVRVSSGWLPPADQPLRIAANVQLDGLVASASARRSELPRIALHLRALCDPGADRIDLAELTTETPHGALKVAGTISELSRLRNVDLSGTLAYDWDEVQALLDERFRGQAVLEGDPIAFRVSGPIGTGPSGVIDRLDGEVHVPIRSLDVFGMELGPTSIDARVRRGQIALAPITGTLNGGRLHLVPEVVRDEHGGWALRLDRGSHLENAAVNDEVSQRFLSYVVPTLADATRVHGYLSADIDRAELPLSGHEGQYAEVEGQVVFRNVEFVPGPLALGLLDLVGIARGPTLKVDQPVVLSIHDGKVHQRGLGLPLGDVARIAMDGTVGFDKSLDLQVSLPLSSAKFANVPVFGEIAGAINPVVPIRGTLDEPRIDGAALGRNLGRMGLNIGGRAAAGGLDALIDLINRPRDPAAEAERRAEMERRREERRLRQERKKLERQQKPRE